jgi:hypothetical protein
MKYPFSIALVLWLSRATRSRLTPQRTRPLRVLYVGNKDTDRGRSYARFLERFNHELHTGRRVETSR